MIEGTNHSHLDQSDKKILAALSTDGRISITNLATKIGMSKTPCSVRVKRLVDEGFILGFKAILNPSKLDINHVAFVEVKLSDTTEPALSAFNAAVYEIAEIEQCHLIAGQFDYLLKVRTVNIADYRRVLAEDISTLPNVANTSTYVAMEAVKEVVI